MNGYILQRVLLVAFFFGATQLLSTNDELIEAIKAGKKEEVERLIAAGADVNARDQASMTPLMHAVGSTSKKFSGEGISQIVKQLFDDPTIWPQKAAVPYAPDYSEKQWNQVDSDGHMDVQLGGEKIRVDLRGDDDTEFRVGKPIIIHQDDMYDTAIVELLIQAGADINARNLDGDTILMSAIHVNDHATVGVLIKANATIDARDYDGRTALMATAMKGNSKIAKILIDGGADIHAKYKFEESELKRVAGAFSVGFPHEWDALIMAANNGHYNVFELLLNDIDCNENNKDCQDAFFIACNRGQNRIVELLLKRGMNPNQHIEGMYALNLAIYAGDERTVGLLIKAGATLNHGALFLAIARGKEKIVVQLIKAGA